MTSTLLKRAVALTASASLLASGVALASSHREAPFITQHPKVDGTDFYMFRSYETGRADYVTLIANYSPLQDAYGGPNYFTMDPEALYEIHIDNDGDAREDITFQFRFQNTLANSGNGIQLPIGPADGGAKNVGIPLIQAGGLGVSSVAALNVQETYSLKIVRGHRRTGQAAAVTDANGGSETFTKPVDYIGTKTFADYDAYAGQFVRNINIPGCNTQGRVFVGQRAEGFAVNLGQIFDLVNLNPVGDRDQGLNTIGDKNVTALALEIPIACLRASGETAPTTIGGWTTASKRQGRVLNPRATYGTPAKEGGAWVQLSRLGMPLVNEVVIGVKDKDRFNSSRPEGDGQFIDYVTHPTLPALLEILFGGAGVRAPTAFPRNDLVTAFLTGVEGVNKTTTACEYVRLNTALPATPAGSQNSLGAAGCFINGVLTVANNPNCDPAGFPNGRRPGDDVTDIALRVSMGYLLPPASAPSGQLPLTDGAIQQASQFDATFPYLTSPNPGSL